jgi:hypothetical protein
MQNSHLLLFLFLITSVILRGLYSYSLAPVYTSFTPPAYGVVLTVVDIIYYTVLCFINVHILRNLYYG